MSNALDASTALKTLETLPIGMLIVNDDRIQWVNDALLQTFHSEKAEIIGLQGRLASGTRFATLFEHTDRLGVTMPGGETRWFERNCIRVADGSLSVHCLQDITARVELETECQRLRAEVCALETKDSVTGLLNRKTIMHVLETQASRSRRYENPLSLLRLSLEASASPDELAEALHNISLALKDQLRWADQLGMLDATTFLIILPETSMADAKDLAFHLANNRIPLPEKSTDLSITFGAASWQKGDDPRKLLRRLQEDQQLASIALLS